ncbi:hypothetical protein N9K16_05620 [Alphaproteobacteria bacterium]|jgi:hypothetical protein|nr:hypothetical protein [Alphaproteobacteria bacterium]
MKTVLTLLLLLSFPVAASAALSIEGHSKPSLVAQATTQVAGGSFFSHSSKGSYSSSFGNRGGFIVRKKPGEFRFHKQLFWQKKSLFNDGFSVKEKRCRQSRRNYYSDYCYSVRRNDLIKRGGN